VTFDKGLAYFRDFGDGTGDDGAINPCVQCWSFEKQRVLWKIRACSMLPRVISNGNPICQSALAAHVWNEHDSITGTVVKTYSFEDANVRPFVTAAGQLAVLRQMHYLPPTVVCSLVEGQEGPMNAGQHMFGDAVDVGFGFVETSVFGPWVTFINPTTRDRFKAKFEAIGLRMLSATTAVYVNTGHLTLAERNEANVMSPCASFCLTQNNHLGRFSYIWTIHDDIVVVSLGRCELVGFCLAARKTIWQVHCDHDRSPFFVRGRCYFLSETFQVVIRLCVQDGTMEDVHFEERENNSHLPWQWDDAHVAQDGCFLKSTHDATWWFVQ